MALLRFRLTPPELASRLPELRKSYVTSLDRTPSRFGIEFRSGLMIGYHEGPESVRVHVPWPVEGFGMPIVATATLAERVEPYDLAVELARGKLNDVRNQMADWVQVGLQSSPALDEALKAAYQAFTKAVTAQDDPARAAEQAGLSLSSCFRAGQLLVEAYTDQVLKSRLEHTRRLPTRLGCGLMGDPKRARWAGPLAEAINAARLRCSWAAVAPMEGQFQWDEVDAQLHWCRRKRLVPQAGPLLELRPTALPDWLWLWEGDFDAISGFVADLVRSAVARYRGKVSVWHLVHRPASGDILGLSEEEQIRLTARVLQIARQADPDVHLVVDLDRPWAEWLGHSTTFQTGPLHLADSLARAEIGLSGVGLEVAPGYGPPGSHARDLLEFSKLLDLYAFLNVPLHVSLVAPSSSEPDPNVTTDAAAVEPSQWPDTPDEASQREWAARWVALAVAKPFVRSVTWVHADDAQLHVFAHGGLFRGDGTPKPALSWLRDFRKRCLD